MGASISERPEVRILQHERGPVLLQEETHLRRRRRVPQCKGVFDNLVDVYEFDRLERPPDLFPGSREPGTIQNVYQSSLQTGGAKPDAIPVTVDHAEVFPLRDFECLGVAHRAKFVISEADRAGTCVSQIRELPAHGIRLAMKLEGRMVGKHGIRRHLTSQEKRVGWKGRWIRSDRNYVAVLVTPNDSARLE
jgi:hypothetical protein